MGEERVRRGSGREEDDEWNVEDDDQRKRRDKRYDHVMTKARGRSWKEITSAFSRGT